MEDGLYWALALAASGAFLATLSRLTVGAYSAGEYLGRYGRSAEPAARDALERRLEAVDALEDGLAVLGETLRVALYVAAALAVLGAVGGGWLAAFVLGLVAFDILALDVIPRSIARAFPERILHGLLPALLLGAAPLRAIARSRAAAVRFVVRALGGRNEREPAEAVEEEILSAVEEGEREGVLEEGEKRMIESIIEFRDSEVKEVMTPRTEIVAIRAGAPVSEAIHLVRGTGHSRIPVYEGSRDSIVGILYAKDILLAWGEAGLESKPVGELVRRAYFVPETKKISTLFAEFRAQRLHIAIVLDEYGGTAGLVTIEDIIEEIVGEIADEYEPRETRARMRRLDDATLEVDARVHVDELNDEYDLHIPDEGDYETVGGFLFSAMGRIPTVGERYECDGLRFEIIEADERRIRRVQIRMPGSGESVAGGPGTR